MNPIEAAFREGWIAGSGDGSLPAAWNSSDARMQERAVIGLLERLAVGIAWLEYDRPTEFATLIHHLFREASPECHREWYTRCGLIDHNGRPSQPRWGRLFARLDEENRQRAIAWVIEQASRHCI